MPRQFDHLPQMALLLHKAAAEAVRKVCFDVQAAAQSKVPVDTGYLKSSIYVHTYQESTYGQNVASGGPGKDLLPDVGKPPNDTTGFIGVGAHYGIYLEFGTSRAPAQPYLTPAAEEIAPVFAQVMEKIGEKFAALGVIDSGQ